MNCLTSGAFDWALLTSTNAVEWLFNAMTPLGYDARLFGGCQRRGFGHSDRDGPSREHGIIADITAAEFTSDGLLAALLDATPSGGLNGARVLLPRGDGASPRPRCRHARARRDRR